MADQVTTTTSKQFTLNVSDLLKGLLVAVVSAVLTVIETSISANNFHFDWKAIGIVALTTGVSYLLKNFFTPAQTIVSPPPAPGPTVINIPKPGDTTTK
jgi:hypothetical protein